MLEVSIIDLNMEFWDVYLLDNGAGEVTSHTLLFNRFTRTLTRVLSVPSRVHCEFCLFRLHKCNAVPTGNGPHFI